MFQTSITLNLISFNFPQIRSITLFLIYPPILNHNFDKLVDNLPIDYKNIV